MNILSEEYKAGFRDGHDHGYAAGYAAGYVDALNIEAQRMELPKRGKWVREMNVHDEPFYHCSVCGECFDSNRDDAYGIFNYCPNCGAWMEVQE